MHGIIQHPAGQHAEINRRDQADRKSNAESGGDARRMAFDAYAVSADQDDPLNKALLALGSRTEDLDERLAEILRRLDGLESEASPDLRRKAG